MVELPPSVEFWLQLLLAGLLLFFGRRLFWLCLATLGFLLTFSLVSSLSIDLQPSLILLLAIGLGIVGAFLAVFLQNVAAGVAGFLFGLYATVSLLGLYGAELGNLVWVLGVAGGVIAGFLALRLFGVALIVLSSFVGSGLVMTLLDLNELPEAVVFLALAVLGIVVQFRGKNRKKRQKRKKREK